MNIECVKKIDVGKHLNYIHTAYLKRLRGHYYEIFYCVKLIIPSTVEVGLTKSKRSYVITNSVFFVEFYIYIKRNWY